MLEPLPRRRCFAAEGRPRVGVEAHLALQQELALRQLPAGLVRMLMLQRVYGCRGRRPGVGVGVAGVRLEARPRAVRRARAALCVPAGATMRLRN